MANKFQVESDSSVRNQRGTFVRFGAVEVHHLPTTDKFMITTEWSNGVMASGLSLTRADATNLINLLSRMVSNG